MAEVTFQDVYNQLVKEHPNAHVRLAGNDLVFDGAHSHLAALRAKELVEKARLFNGHLHVGHVGNKRNWWKRV